VSLPRVFKLVKDAIARIRSRFYRGPRHLRLGKLGEDLAANKLASEGYRLVDRNLKVAGREVDIIAVEGEYLVFVEVKTRSDASFGHPLLAVDNKRRTRLRQAAGMYVAKRGLRSILIRFDVVTVEFGASSEAKVELIRNAF